jgi:hypothetical protein
MPNVKKTYGGEKRRKKRSTAEPNVLSSEPAKININKYIRNYARILPNSTSVTRQAIRAV